MKKLLLLLFTISILISCSTSRESTKLARNEKRIERKQQEQIKQEILKSAVETKRFIVKLDRIYMNWGMIDLVPRMNYIIIDGNKAIINAAYFGRQWDIRPIAGINMKGTAESYELTDKSPKGLYEISMKVENGSAKFDVYLSVSKSGNVSASINGLRIQNARYHGFVVPISGKKGQENEQDSDVI